MADYDKMYELADEHDLEFVETTDGMNGYPQNLEPALIGFETFEQAEKFSQEHGLETWIFHKRDGWQLWERRNPAYEAFENTAEDYGDNYNVFKADELEDYYEQEIRPCLDNFDNLEDLKDFIEDQEEIMNELDRCDENEAVVTYCGRLYDTIKVRSMEWYHDTHSYVIGVL